MTLTRLTNEQLLADIRQRLDQGYTVATAERVKSIAKDATDVDLLRQLVGALANAMIDPKPRKAGRPRKSAASINGVIDMDAAAPKTAREQASAIKAMVRERGVCEQIYTAHHKHGKNIKAECQRHQIGVDTYYKWFPAGS